MESGLDIGLFALAAAVFSMAFSLGRQRRDRYLYRRIDMLFRHLGIDPDAEVREEVMPLLRSNRKVPAMRIYRQRTGADLQTAQQVVERWMMEVASEMVGEPSRPADR